MESIEVGKKEIWIFEMKPISSNMYVYIEGDQALLVDPNISIETWELLQKNGIKSLTVLVTHEHYDHISGINWFREKYPCEVLCSSICDEYMRQPEKNMSKYFDVLYWDKESESMEMVKDYLDKDYSCHGDRIFKGRYSFQWKNHKVELFEAPGHSPGGTLILLDEGVLFTGDNLVNGTKVITRLPNGSRKDYREKTKPLLLSFPENLMVLPGHGACAKLGEILKYAG